MRQIKTTSIVHSLMWIMSLSIGVVMSGSTAKADNDYALPATPGLYVSEYIEWDNDIVKTNKDQSNNVILINHNNEQIKWRDQDNPEYLTVGMSDDNTEYWWGPGFENGSEIWLDYIADGKVTHLNQEDISITELDGSPCEDISLSPDSRDQRVCVFHMNTSETKKVIISYKTPDNLTNSKFVAEFALRTGFYYDEEMSVDSHIIDEPTVVRGSDKDIYVHLTDTWEGDGFSLNDTNAISISYWDDEKKTDANVEGEDAKEFAELEPVSVKNDNHLIYKLKLKGSDKVYDRYEVIINYNRYNKTNVEEAPREEDRRIQVKIIDSDTLYAASQDNLQVQGDHYYYPDNSDYRKNDYFSANSLSSPIYMSFRFYNEEGGIVDLMDPSTLSFYRSEYNEDLKKEILTKVDSSVVKAEKAYSDSNIIKISYVGDTTKEENDWNEFIVTYGDKEPSDGNMGDAIELAFVTSDFNDVSAYTSENISEDSFTNEFLFDGTSDIKMYIAGIAYDQPIMGKMVQSVEDFDISLIDESGNDYSNKVKIETDNTIKAANNHELTCNSMITIPKDTLQRSAVLTLNCTLKGKRYDNPDDLNLIDHNENYTLRIFIFYDDIYTLYAASSEYRSVKATQYTYSDTAEYKPNGYFAANSVIRPIYMSFKYKNDEGQLVPVTDPSKLAFYSSELSDDLDTEVLTQVDSTVIKAEKPYTDSNIIKVSYIGDTTKEEHRWNEFVVSYNGKYPKGGNMDNAIELAFVTSDFDEVGTYNSTVINESTFSNEFNTDGTSDVNIYAATLDYKEDLVWNYVESAELKSLKLIDEKGSDLSSKANTDTNVKLTRSKKPAIVYGEKITIPKGVLSSSARLELNFTANCNHWLDPEAGTRTTSLESYTVYAYIIYTPHTHTAVSDWSKDDNNHWHECTASDGATLDKAAHTWDNGVVTTPAATDKEGVMTYTCTVCKATKTQSIDKLPQPTIQPDTTQTTTQTTDTSQTSKVETGTSTTPDEKGVTYTVTEVNTDGTAEVEFSAKDSTEKTIVIPETTTVNGVTATVTTIANNAFLGNKTVSSVTIPETVDTIGKNAFSNCTSIKKITIPKSVTTIGENAFSGCTNLTTVNIKSTTISKIETGAFKNCKKLTKVTVPSSITTIGKNAFSGDKNLKTITIKSTKIKSIGKNAFKNVPKKATIKVPKKKKTTYTKLLKKAGFKGKIK